ncbi:hypothetical protein PAMC26510_27215 [Caballeronia sordidicola]|uniref:Uncharacterized protein n=1 Tax=Caballeronia sordidicola TaxID=196367 RepID=A0A242MDH4_CABSO|nr:hypothetical protein PAMC26510_27215 [Caballeronia sordidicola]
MCLFCISDSTGKNPLKTNYTIVRVLRGVKTPDFHHAREPLVAAVFKYRDRCAR